MRQIKFRIWDKELNKFYEPIFKAYEGQLMELLITTCGEIVRRGMTLFEHQSVFPDRYVIQQFTGLLDKNGKERYESDILKVEWTTDSKGGYLQSSDAYCENEEIVIITWVGDGFKYLRRDGKGFSIPKSASIEVIGDIYSTPSLLTK